MTDNNHTTDTVAPLLADSTVKFKKRSAKGNMRRKPISLNEDGAAESKEVDSSGQHSNGLEEEEESIGVDLSVIRDIKLQQTLRQRKVGSSADNLSRKRTAMKGHTENLAPGTVAEEVTLETMMGTQFSSQMDYGLQNSIPHQQIMDQFINKQLGIDAEEKQDVNKSLTADDLLYKVPEHMKVKSDTHQVRNNKAEAEAEDDGVQLAWSTGIAEVALPIQFKLHNIEATEKAAKKQGIYSMRPNDLPGSEHLLPPNAVPEAEAAVAANTKMPFSRFFVADQQVKETFLEAAELEGLDPKEIEKHRHSLKRSMQSSDDYYLERYKKRQQQHWN